MNELTPSLGDAGWLETLRVDGELSIGRVAGWIPTVWSGREVKTLPEPVLRTLRTGRPLDPEGWLGLVVGEVDDEGALVRAVRALPPPNPDPAQWVVDPNGEVRSGTAPPPRANLHDVLVHGRRQVGRYVLRARPLRGWPAGEATGQWLVDARPARRSRASPLVLTDRQREVALHAAQGATIPQIARALSRSEETVKTHLRAAYQRMSVGSRVELARVLC